MKPVLLSIIAFLSFSVGAQCFSSVAVSNFGTLAIDTDGAMWAWGGNFHGELGLGAATPPQYVPIRVGNDHDWSSVYGGEADSFAIKTDGTLWAWGRNEYGQAGNGTIGEIGQPVQVGTDSDWMQVSGYNYHTLALKADGTLWGWGNEANFWGFINSLQPVQIGTGTWLTLSAAQHYVMAIRSDGTLWGWGRNENGVLGDGTQTNRLDLIQIGTDSDWVSVSALASHTLALKANGTLWAWGDNTHGALGDGTIQARWTPTQIGTDTDWASVSAGYMTSKAIKTNGTCWSWGFNANGQIGDGTTIDKYAPVMMGSGTNWAHFYQSLNYWQLGLTTDNTLYGWGSNNYGQATADGTNTVNIQPMPISCTLLGMPQEALAGFSIYPNPAGAKLFVQTDAVLSEVAVFDMAGRKLLSAGPGASGIDVSSLQNGNYVIRATTGFGSQQARFIKE